MIFDEDLCVIQDHTSKSPIGVGRLPVGVYCFDKLWPSTAQVNAVGSHNLWHDCLGHHSNQVLSLLSKEFNLSSSFGNMLKDLVIFAFVPNTCTQFVARESHC